MEAFSLLKYWRGVGGGATLGVGPNVRTVTTTIPTAASHDTAETDNGDGNDGPFFDLEFTVPPEEDKGGGGDEQDDLEEDNDFVNCIDSGGNEEADGENEGEFKFALSRGSSGSRPDPYAPLSPSDDLFFKGRHVVPLEPPSEQNAKPQFSVLKSASKFRVLKLKFNKSKPNLAEKTEEKQGEKQEEPNQKQNRAHSKLFTVKFKVEEVSIMSLFTRDNSSRASSGGDKCRKVQSSDESASSDEKRFSKDAMQKYLKMVKPLYIRPSKRYTDKMVKSGLSSPCEAEPEETSVKACQKQGNFPAGLGVVVRKHFAKSRSALAAVAAAPSGRRRDDSLLQQQDGIQSAILHCKRSFNGSNDLDSSLLWNDKSMELRANCSEGAKETAGI